MAFPMCESKLVECLNQNWTKSLAKTLNKLFMNLGTFLTPVSQVITLLFPQKRPQICSLERMP